MELSKEQQAAVVTDKSRVLVAAAAGSGKTAVIIERIKFLLNKGVLPENIYAITYTNMAAQEMLERIGDAPVFIGTIHSLANKILLSNGIETSHIIEEKSFDKLLEIAASQNIVMPPISHLLVDEFQDISNEEDIFIMDTLQADNIFVVGDSCQCQPKGTKVLLKTGEIKNIEDIIVGDKVAGCNIHDSARITKCGKYANGYTVLQTKKHIYYNDYLYTIRTEEGFLSSYTSNHKHYVRMKESDYNYIIYLMRNSKNQFRIGTTKLYHDKQGRLGLRLRMIQENCIDGWIIDVYKTEKEARLKEIELSTLYGIPQIIFDTNKIQFSGQDIDNLYKKINSEERAYQCLFDYKKNIRYPFLSINDNKHFARNASVEIYACNIFKEIMDVITYDSIDENCRKISSISELIINYIYSPIEVYSLDIDKVHNYVADNILTHNSIYGFKGGNFQNFMRLVRDKKVKVYNLTTNYRNTENILLFAERYLMDMHDVYRIHSVPNNRKLGYVETLEYSLQKIANFLNQDEYKDWFVLARTNAQIETIMNFLKNKNIPCTTFKKSEKTYSELKEELDNNVVKVLTIHSAKGLESKNVIVVGLQPFNNEEKRVCYVACTRAKEHLIIMDTPKRGKRAKMGMYDDDAGAVIDFTKARAIKATKLDSVDINAGYFPHFPAPEEVRMHKIFGALDREWKNKYCDLFSDEDIMDSEPYFPTNESMMQDWINIWNWEEL